MYRASFYAKSSADFKRVEEIHHHPENNKSGAVHNEPFRHLGRTAGDALVQPRFTLPTDLQEPAERKPSGSDGTPCRSEAQLSPVSRGKLCRGAQLRKSLELESDDRPARTAFNTHEPMALSIVGRHGASGISRVVRRPEHGTDCCGLRGIAHR